MITQLYAIVFLAPTIAPWSQVTYIYPRTNLKQGIFRMQIEYKHPPPPPPPINENHGIAAVKCDLWDKDLPMVMIRYALLVSFQWISGTFETIGHLFTTFTYTKICFFRPSYGLR